MLTSLPQSSPAFGAPKERRGCGCFFSGCLISLIISIIVGAILLFFISRWIHGALEFYSSPKAEPVVIETIAPAVRDAALAKLARIESFNDKPGESLEIDFTGPELQSIAQSVPQLARAKDHFKIDLGEDTLNAYFSFPIGDLDQWRALQLMSWGLGERFINGETKFEIGVIGGKVSFQVRSVTLNGSPLPRESFGVASDFFTGVADSVVRKTSLSTQQLVERLTAVSIRNKSLHLIFGPVK